MEVIRGLSGFHPNPNAVAAEDRKVVHRGLAVIPTAGMVVQVGEGFGAIQRNAGAPSADQSPYQLVHLRTSTSLPALAASDPVLNRYDLIEVAAVDELTESQSRDIFDPVGNTFAPATVEKIRRSGATITVTTGVAAANPTVPAFAAAASDRMPLAAIRVTAAAVAITANDIVDLRPLWVPALVSRQHGVVDGLVPSVGSMLLDTASIVINRGQAIVDGQMIRRTNDQTITWANHVESGLVVAISTWYYIYLVAGREALATGYRPRHTVPGTPVAEGFIIITDKAPTKDGYPSSAITLPTSFANGHIYGGTVSRALYLGAFKSSFTTASDAAPFFRQGDWIRRNRHVEFWTANIVNGTEVIDLSAATDLPAGCRCIEAMLNVAVDAGAVEQLILVRPSGGSTVYQSPAFSFSPQATQTSVTMSPTFVLAINPAKTVDLLLTGALFNTAASGNEFAVIGIHDPVPRARA
jgi:hypothetical protein